MISGRRPQRILGCPICGYRVDPTDHVCPRCGSEFYEGTKFECPLCGGLVSTNDRSCPSCHVEYSDFRERTVARGSDDDIDALLTEIIDLESNQVKKDAKRFSCPDCGWMLDGSESTCPRCNHDLVTDLSFQCPVCGNIVSSSSKACQECGASFEEPEPVQQAQEPEAVEPKVGRKAEAAAEFLRASERTPPPLEPIKEVKPIVIVKAPPIVAKPSEESAIPVEEPPETRSEVIEQPVETGPRPERVTAEEAPLKPIEPEPPATPSPEQPSAAVQDSQKKGVKRRKLKSKP